MSEAECLEFLKVSKQFKLGGLETEKPHPLTANLSEDSINKLPLAIQSLKRVDEDALRILEAYTDVIGKLGNDIWNTLEEGGRIFLCGCGATGRLSIAIEVFCREGLVPKAFRDRFIGFMAGGDAALIKSIENFEDHPEFGARQLIELGFGTNDLLISTSEGGETPFVIGAAEKAASIADRKPWFLFCNPEDQLVKTVRRSARILTNPRIRSCSLFVGPMGLSGSTRMQASTVLMAAVGWAIKSRSNTVAVGDSIRRFRSFWTQLNLQPLEPFTYLEADLYQINEYVIYQTDTLGVTVLTDTTERSPTFSLSPFENTQDPSSQPAWCYLSIPSAESIEKAWLAILKRPPRCLKWDELTSHATIEYLNGFTIHKDCPKERIRKTNGANQHGFHIENEAAGIRLELQKKSWMLDCGDLDLFDRNLLLKLILNIHSTLIMGRLGRYESNLMTFVKPSNFKLIDRSIRYVQRLACQRGFPEPAYEEAAKELFRIKDSLGPNEPIVIKVLESLLEDPR